MKYGKLYNPTWNTEAVYSILLRKSYPAAFFLLTSVTIFYAICVFASLYFSNIVLSLFFGFFAGVALMLLLIIGHDAAHLAFVESKAINKIIARFAMSFLLHSYSQWVISHNGLHHHYTCIKDLDPAYSPLTKYEYDKLSILGRCWEQFMRSAYGIGINYLTKVWLKWLILPINRNLKFDAKLLPDIFLIFFVFVCQISIVIYIGEKYGDKTAFFSILFGWVFPFLISNYCIGIATYLHHTNPSVQWFKNKKEASFFDRQLLSSVRMEFPKWFNWILMGIMEHTAHHIYPNIPAYNLMKAQRTLEQYNIGNVTIIEPVTIGTYTDATKRCKLFDFDHNCWTDFDGNPTTPSISRVEERDHI